MSAEWENQPGRLLGGRAISSLLDFLSHVFPDATIQGENNISSGVPCQTCIFLISLEEMVPFLLACGFLSEIPSLSGRLWHRLSALGFVFRWFAWSPVSPQSNAGFCGCSTQRWDQKEWAMRGLLDHRCPCPSTIMDQTPCPSPSLREKKTLPRTSLPTVTRVKGWRGATEVLILLTSLLSSFYPTHCPDRHGKSFMFI